MSQNHNPEIRAQGSGDYRRGEDPIPNGESQPDSGARVSTTKLKFNTYPGITSGGRSINKIMSAESTIQKMQEFHGENSIYEDRAIVLPGEDHAISSMHMEPSLYKDPAGFEALYESYSKANPFMSVNEVKQTHAELKQRSSPDNENDLLTRYEELSSQKAKEAKADPLVGSILAEKFQITGLVGTGANATVYKAKQLSNGKIVAVKTIRNRGIEDIWRFKLEIESMRQMDHDNLVRFVDCIIQDKGRIYLVMELVQGISLHEVLKLHGPITDEETICSILIQVCDALAHAHSKKIIHRDLKTGNIVLSKDKAGPLSVKVLDFGLAKHKNETAANITMHGQTLGSPLYMSPEQCRGEEPTVQSDIYSLGILAYEMMTGIVPFIGENIAEIMEAHCDPKIKHIPLAQICPDLRGVDHLERIISKSLATDPAKRFRRVTRLKQALEFWIEGVRKDAYNGEEQLNKIIKDDLSIYQNINDKLRKSLAVTLQILPNKKDQLGFHDATLVLFSEDSDGAKKKLLIGATIFALILAAFFAINILMH